MRRLSCRSARSPAHRLKSSVGSDVTAVTTPSSSALLVSSSTSHPCAVLCIHVPASDSSWPT